jgi:Protein of unknown function (DUF1573).
MDFFGSICAIYRTKIRNNKIIFAKNMIMKRKIILYFSVLSLICAAQLRTAWAQDAIKSENVVIEFNEKVHDFGDVMIADGPVKCEFTFKNISRETITVQNVISSCGCTTPNWTKEPVKAGESGVIKVQFNNDQGPYPFDKVLTVYVTGTTFKLNKPITLRIRGTAHEKKISLNERFPNRIGKFGVRKKQVSIGYVDQGVSKTDFIEVANLSSSSMEVVAVDCTPGLLINITPNPIPAKSIARLTYTVHPAYMKEKAWGKTDFSTRFTLNGIDFDQKFVVTATIKDNFDTWDKAQIARAAEPFIEKSYFEFGNVKRGKKVDAAFSVTNKGKSDLVIHKVECDKKGVTFITKFPYTIKAGSTGTIKASLSTSGLDGEVLYVLNAITNTPQKPMFNLFITGNVD